MPRSESLRDWRGDVTVVSVAEVEALATRDLALPTERIDPARWPRVAAAAAQCGLARVDSGSLVAELKELGVSPLSFGYDRFSDGWAFGDELAGESRGGTVGDVVIALAGPDASEEALDEAATGILEAIVAHVSKGRLNAKDLIAAAVLPPLDRSDAAVDESHLNRLEAEGGTVADVVHRAADPALARAIDSAEAASAARSAQTSVAIEPPRWVIYASLLLATASALFVAYVILG